MSQKEIVLLQLTHMPEKRFKLLDLNLDKSGWSAVPGAELVFLEGDEMVVRKTGHVISVARRSRSEEP